MDKIENENELGEYGSDEGEKRERTLCGSWGQKVGVGGGSEVFGGDDKWGWQDTGIGQEQGWEGGKGYRGVKRTSLEVEGTTKQEETKLQVYNSIVVPTLMHGSEAWVVNKQQESAIHATEKKVLRRITEKRMVDRVRNEEIRDELQQEGVLEKGKGVK